MSRLAAVARGSLAQVGRLGAATIRTVRGMSLACAFGTAVAARALRPGTWRRTVRAELARQLFESGVTSLRIVALIALLLGAGIFVNLLRVAGEAGQAGLTRDVAALFLIAHGAPLLVALVAVGRSGVATMAELGAMRVTGQLELLEAQGIDPFSFLAIPRVIALTIVVPVLTAVLTVLTLAAGYLTALATGATSDPALDFAESVFRQVTPSVYIAVTLKTTLSGFFVGVIACLTGLRGAVAMDLPRLLSAGFVRCVVAVLLIAAFVGVLVR